MILKSSSVLLVFLATLPEGAMASLQLRDSLRNALIPDFVQDVMGISFRGEPGYQITLEFNNVDDTAEFVAARSRWGDVITGDVADRNGWCSLGDTQRCGAIPCSIDDLYICASYESLDTGILGSSFPSYFRSNELPIAGEMVIDKDQIEGFGLNLQDIILREMGVVVGIGSIWSSTGLVDSLTPPCKYALNSMASIEYREVSDCPASSAMPIENNLGSGVDCKTWDEACFDKELMTGAIDPNPALSRFTIAGLDDLGYSVDYSKADAYTAADMSCISCLCNCRKEEEEAEANNPPKQELSEEGYQKAYEYGQKVLAENAKQRESFLFAWRLDESEYGYMGDQVVSVVVHDNGKAFAVMVTAE